MIVSHDSGFLDSVCTDIYHYENRKLKLYKGNLSEFVKVWKGCESAFEKCGEVWGLKAARNGGPHQQQFTAPPAGEVVHAAVATCNIATMLLRWRD